MERSLKQVRRYAMKFWVALSLEVTVFLAGVFILACQTSGKGMHTWHYVGMAFAALGLATMLYQVYRYPNPLDNQSSWDGSL